MTDIVVRGVESPLYCLMIQDSAYRKCTLVQLGEKGCLIRKMREISEVLYIGGDPVEQDMSNAVTGYPTINHKGVHLQVISYKDFLEGEEGLDVSRFIATGEHLS